MTITLNSPAPDFTLSDQEGVVHSLSQYRGSWVLLYFYPRDMTPGCTKEACAIRDAWEDFGKQNTIILGVSTDTIASHQKFAQKHELPFTLLADEEKKVVRQYDVWGQKTFMGKINLGTRRTSFLIDPQGIIVKIYEKVKPDMHALEVLKDLKILANK